MKLYIDTDTNLFVNGPKFLSPLKQIEFKRGDYSKIELQFLNGSLLAGLSATNVILGIKPIGVYDGDFLVTTSDFTFLNNFYTFYPNFNTIELNAVLGSGNLSAADVPNTTTNFEVTWSTDGSTWNSSNIITSIINNDIIKNSESTPLYVGSRGNVASGDYSSVLGLSSIASGRTSMAFGEGLSSTGAYSSTVGFGNSASGYASAIAGGYGNTASGDNSNIAGGLGNYATCHSSNVAGGLGNCASGCSSTVGGGSFNNATCYSSNVAGGLSNWADGNCSNIGGGIGNKTTGEASTVAGGNSNCSNGDYSNIAGGYSNCVYGAYSNIAGGCNNVINLSARFSSILAGSGITALSANTAYAPTLNLTCVPTLSNGLTTGFIWNQSGFLRIV